MLLLVMVALPQSNITRVEYYLDNDPGYGNGTVVSITPGTNISGGTVNINPANVGYGIHFFGIRALTASGAWSMDNKWLLVKPFQSGSAANLKTIEYYIDTDPGYGNAKPISFTASSNLSNVALNIDPTPLGYGLHLIGIRAMDANGSWSLNNTWLFVKSFPQANAPNVSKVEYYIDNDPGYGKANAVSFSAGSNVAGIPININPANLSNGMHLLGIRAMDASGSWGMDNKWLFVKPYPVGPSPNLSRAEYYVDNDPGYGKGTAINFTPGNNISNMLFNIDTSVLNYGKHVFFMRSKDTNGAWCLDDTLSFINCPTALPLAGFNYAVSGKSVSFSNTTTNASSFLWNFGDGDTSSLKNPLHQYDSAGLYKAYLVAGSSCLPTGDTLFQNVTISGLNSINTNHGGNTGNVSVAVTGGGFYPGIHLYLHKSGEADIYGDTLVIQDSSIIYTTFNLAGKDTGTYDVIAVFTNGLQDTLHNGFTIEPGTNPKLWVNITGDWALRAGFNQVYTVTYGNDANTDAILMPLMISGLPLGTDIEVLQPLFKLDSLPGFDTLNLSSYPVAYTINDTADNMSFRMLFISKIPASSTGILNLIFHLPANAIPHSYTQIVVTLGKPLSDTNNYVSNVNAMNNLAYLSAPVSNDSSSAAEDCLNEIAAQATTQIAGDLEGVEPTGLAQCFAGRVELQKIFATFTSHLKNPNPFKIFFDVADFAKTLISTGLSCVRPLLVGAAFSDPVLVLPAVVLFELDLEAQKVVEYGGVVLNAGKLIVACHKAFQSASQIRKMVEILFNWDPNSKYGPGDSLLGHFINTSNPISYVINFESSPLANVNAQTITVTDTLKPAYFDYGSFSFTTVTLGDSIYVLGYPSKSFFHDFDFTSLYGVKARVTATFDTITGVAQWKFLTIDPLTNQATNNALAGFLPPDIVSPQGQGYVSYIIRPNKNLVTNDIICNNATIVFDNNPAITTNCWQNIFDLVPPTSKVDSLPAITFQQNFKVNWSGHDNLSGIRNYKIYVSINDSAFVPWLASTDSTSGFYPGSYSNKYAFYSIATDNAGNTEPPKNIAEAITLDSLLTYTWLGVVSSDWMTSGNWSGGIVPAINNDVIIPAGTPFSPTVIAGTNTSIRDILLLSGAKLYIQKNATLYVTH